MGMHAAVQDVVRLCLALHLPFLGPYLQEGNEENLLSASAWRERLQAQARRGLVTQI